MSSIEIKKEFFCLTHLPTPADGEPCNLSPCIVNGNCFRPCNTCIIPFCFILPVIVFNADIEITGQDGGITVIPTRSSEVLQYTIISQPCTDKFETRIFRFPSIPNDNRDRFNVQFRNNEGKLECREILFEDVEKALKERRKGGCYNKESY